MKARNHYVYITAASLACYREQGGGLELLASVAVPRDYSRDRELLDQGMQKFEAHLDRYPHDSYFVVTDTQAEAYQAETVPILSRRDMRLLLSRKMDQRYRATRYRAVVPHRSRPYAFLRAFTRRRSRTTTRILYGLVNPEALEPWLNALEHRALNVRGLYSLGTLMPALLAHLKLPPGSDALIVVRTAAGYRHAFVAPSGLRFSRLCVYSNAGDAQVGQEIDKTLQYLTMTRLWGVENRHRMLHIAVIDAQPSPIALTVPGSNLRTAQLIQLRPSELVPSGPAALLDDANSAWLMFNPAVMREHGLGCAAGLALAGAGRRANTRRGALAATAAAILASTGYLAFTEIAVREKSALAATAELIADHVNTNADDIERALPKTSLEPEQLRAVVQTRDRLLARNIDAYGLMQRTAAALAAFSNLDVDVLEWSYPDAAGAAGMAGIPGMASAPATASAPSPTPDGSAAASPNTIRVRVGGHVGASLLKSDANASVAGLAATLARELQGRQSIEKLPFDITPGGTLAGNPAERIGANADFSIIVTVPAVDQTATLTVPGRTS
ncbi:MAG: hypothetical protein JWN43_3588 [Gammaproteobacteria bacterium]|nr:hypothetical protein [Gammaproteobacteria bacterium]